jgi:hypothetical protein
MPTASPDPAARWSFRPGRSCRNCSESANTSTCQPPRSVLLPLREGRSTSYVLLRRRRR